MKNASEALKNKIKAVLGSNLTPYRIAKEVGLSNATPVHKYIDGRSDISNMSLAVAVGFEKLYEEMMEVRNIEGIIAKVEAWEIKLVDAEPDYHERDYIDAATEQYIIHKVDVEMEDDEELEVFFAERDYVKELRDQIYSGEKTEDDFEELVINELSDQYDYDKVVAYRVDGGQIEWI